MADSIEDRFAVETELLGLKLLPGQEANLRAAYVVLREAIALVGAGHLYTNFCLLLAWRETDSTPRFPVKNNPSSRRFV